MAEPGLVQVGAPCAARELLATTNAPVDQIARSVGFSSRSHFSYAFRTAYGVDPTNFRAAAFGKSKSALE